MARREVRAEARGMSCLNMTAGLPEDTERRMNGERGVAMGERCLGSSEANASFNDRSSSSLHLPKPSLGRVLCIMCQPPPPHLLATSFQTLLTPSGRQSDFYRP